MTYQYPYQGPPVPFPPPPPPPRRSRTGLFIGLGAAALVLVTGAGAAVGLVAGRFSAPGATPGTKAAALGADGTAVTVTRPELDALMNARATALTKGDLTGFLAALDPAKKPMLAQQRKLFANLRKLTFTTARFQTVEQVGRNSDRFGRPVTVQLDVAFVHQIKDYDAEPVEEWYRWTIVKKTSTAPLVVTAVGPAPAESAQNSESVMYPAPWDKWTDMRVVTTEHTMFLIDAPMLAKTRRYAPVAEKAARTVLRGWRSSGAEGEVFDRFVSSLVPTRGQLGSIYQVIKGKATEAGRMMPMPASNFGAAHSGSTRSVFDASSGFFSGGVDEAGGAAEIFRHEYAHAMIQRLERYEHPDAGIFGPPQWIIEGFAEYVANRGRPDPGFRSAESRRMVRDRFDGKLPDRFYDILPGEVSYDYFLSHQAYRYIAKKYGDAKAFQFAAEYYVSGKSLYAVFKDVLHTDTTSFQRGWAAFVRADAR